MRAANLSLLVAFACLSVIFGPFIIIKFATLLFPFSQTPFHIISDFLRSLVVLAIAYAWLVAWKRVAERYFWKTMKCNKL